MNQLVVGTKNDRVLIASLFDVAGFHHSRGIF